MRDIPERDPLIDELDALLDEALAHPARADAVKARIRARLARRPGPAVSAAPAEDNWDAEDLWDNVPL